MKTRFIWLVFGLAFFVTLAVIVGQRLSAEAMAVVVGVVAGVAASIPTSLIVVWMAMQASGRRSESLARPMVRSEAEARPVEPRIVVVTAPPMPASQAGYGASMPMALSGYSSAPRRFTVIGGAEVAYDESPSTQEGVWPQ